MVPDEEFTPATQYEAVGKRVGLTGYPLARYTRYMRVRYPQGQSTGYVLDWAGRFVNHREWEAADERGRQVLAESDALARARGQVSGEWGCTRPHHFYTDAQVARIVAKGQTPIRHHGGPCSPDCAKGRVAHTHRIDSKARRY